LVHGPQFEKETGVFSNFFILITASNYQLDTFLNSTLYL